MDSIIKKTPFNVLTLTDVENTPYGRFCKGKWLSWETCRKDIFLQESLEVTVPRWNCSKEESWTEREEQQQFIRHLKPPKRPSLSIFWSACRASLLSHYDESFLWTPSSWITLIPSIRDFYSPMPAARESNLFTDYSKSTRCGASSFRLFLCIQAPSGHVILCLKKQPSGSASIKLVMSWKYSPIKCRSSRWPSLY